MLHPRFVDLFCTRLVFWGMARRPPARVASFASPPTHPPPPRARLQVGVDMGDDPSSEVYRTAMWAQNNNPATSRHMVVPPGEACALLTAPPAHAPRDPPPLMLPGHRQSIRGAD